MSDFRKVKVVSFDAGGTLFYPYPSVGQQYADALAEVGVEAEPEAIEARFMEVFREASLLKRTRINEAEEYRFWREVVSRTFDGICPPESFDTVYETLFHRFTSSKVWRLFPDTRSTLEALKEHGYRLVVLSNADKRFYTVFEEFGLEAYFEQIFISSEIGVEKPDAEAFRIVQAKVAAVAAEIVHVGDSLHHDGDGAHNAGWHSLVLKKDIQRLADLLDLLPGR